MPPVECENDRGMETGRDVPPAFSLVRDCLREVAGSRMEIAPFSGMWCYPRSFRTGMITVALS